MTPEKKRAVVADLKKDKTITSIVETHGVDRHDVRAIAAELGIKRRPGPPPGGRLPGKIDEARLRQLVNEKHDAPSCARIFRVSRQAVYQACKRWGIELGSPS